MSSLARRLPTALAYGAIVILAVAGPWPTFAVLVVTLFALGVVELAVLYRGRAERSAVVVAGAVYLGIGLGALLVLWDARDAGASFAVPDVLVGAGITSLPAWLFLALVPTWAADVASYAAGSAIGRRRLAPRVSPGKTWEGTIGGFVAAALACMWVGSTFGLPPASVAVAAIGVGPVALAGDLVESWAKRRVGAKDSSALLPGHGGILDRIDSLLAVAPYVALAMTMGNGLG